MQGNSWQRRAMIRALMWKECREQRAAWLAITAIGTALIVVTAQWLQGGAGPTPDSRAAYLVAGALLLSWCYGIVSGAMLLAGEREDGTLEFIDSLPVWRARLWRVKGLAALGLLVAQAAVAAPVLAALGAVGTVTAATTAMAGMLAAGSVGLGWGLFCSAQAPTVMGAIVRAAGVQALAAVLLGVLLALAWVTFDSLPRRAPQTLVTSFILAAGVLSAGAGTASARSFTRPDRQRRAAGRPLHNVSGFVSLAWLTARQLWHFAAVVAVLGLAGGLGVLFSPMLTWPVLTLLLGVVCGLRAFSNEGSARAMLIEHRVPLAGFWLAHVVACGIIALLACLLALAPPAARLLPSLLRLESGNTELIGSLVERLFGDRRLDALVRPGLFLTLWVVHGFAAGLLCGQLLRRTGIAVPAAVLAAGAGAAVWLPSMVGGGLQVWQVLGMPVVFVLASLVLLPAWAGGPLDGRRAAAGLFGAFALAAVWTAAGLWYRVTELPPVPAEMDVAAWLRNMPDPANDEAGRLTRAALTEVTQRQAALIRRPSRPAFPRIEGAAAIRFPRQLSLVLSYGWPAGEPELGAWMDQLFEGSWHAQLVRAADLPQGVVLDPRGLAEPLAIPLNELGDVHLVGLLLVGHGLREQARGDHRALAGDLRTGLALVRNLRHRSPSAGWGLSRTVESVLMVGLLRWLERVGDRPQALRAVLEVLRDHDARCPRNPDAAAPANYLIALNSLPHPEVWLAGALPGEQIDNRSVASVVAVLWQAPWEHARQVRTFAWLFASHRRPELDGHLGWPWERFPIVGTERFAQLRRAEPTVVTVARGRLLQVALRLYRAEKGREAPSLGGLVPQYLPSIPADPFDPTGHAFRYRLSRGEIIETGWWTINRTTGQNVRGTRRVRAGQGILWSVGHDGRDDGGQRNNAGATFRVHDDRSDWLFLTDPPDAFTAHGSKR
jgi:hypothetical protein